MKIGLLTQWFDPEPGPASLPAVYGREFIRRGHSVRALTGYPNYPDGVLHDGYRLRPRTREELGGIDVTRVALYPNHSSSAAGRVANYASFALSATVLGSGALRGADAVWVYNSPVTVTLPMLTHTRWGRTPVFLHVQDLWPDSLIHSGMLPSGRIGDFAAKRVRDVVRLAERKATVIGVISEGVRDLILDRHPSLDPAKIVYAPNPTNEQLFRSAERIREELGIDIQRNSHIEVMYAGAVGEVQGLDTLLDAAAMMTHRADIRISIVGDGISRARLEKRVHDEKISNVRFVGRVAQSVVPQFIARSHIQLVSLAKSPFLEFTTPSKIASLLSSGVPVVGQLAGDGARIIDASGAGVAVEPGDADALQAAITAMADGGRAAWRSHGERARAYYDANFAASSTAGTIIDSLTRSTGRGDYGGKCD